MIEMAQQSQLVFCLETNSMLALGFKSGNLFKGDPSPYQIVKYGSL